MPAAHGTWYGTVISKGAVTELTETMAAPAVGLTILQQTAAVATTNRQSDERQIPCRPHWLEAALL